MRIVDPHLPDRPAAHYGGVRANSSVATLISSTSLLLGKLVFESEYVAVELSMSLYIILSILLSCWHDRFFHVLALYDVAQVSGFMEYHLDFTPNSTLLGCPLVVMSRVLLFPPFSQTVTTSLHGS